MLITLMKKNKDQWAGVRFHENCKHQIGPYLTRTGKRYTGLDLLDQERLGKLLNFDLNPDSDFWDTFNLSIGSKTPFITLDTIDPFDELRYKFARNHKDIANGYNDRKPGAEYILIQEEATAEEVMKSAQVEIKALAEYSKMTIEEMRKALRLYGHRSENASIEVVQSTLYQLIKENPKKYLTIWVNNIDKEIQYLIEEAVATNVLRKNKSTYKYGTDTIGYSLEDTIDYIKNPAHADVKLAIKSQIEGKQQTISAKIDKVNKSELTKLKEEINSELEK